MCEYFRHFQYLLALVAYHTHFIYINGNLKTKQKRTREDGGILYLFSTMMKCFRLHYLYNLAN